jgi:hypothetical protein
VRNAIHAAEEEVVDEHFLADEWSKARGRSRQMLPVAGLVCAAFGATVYLTGLHRSETAFLWGVLVGTLLYWVILEGMTIVRIGRLLRAARTETKTGP